jgi:uncharacterized protein (DUF1499 family)
MQKTRFGWVSSLALLLAVIAIGLLAAAGPGYRAGWFSLGTALQRMMTWAAYTGIVAVVLGLLGAALGASRGGRALAVPVFAILLGGMAVAVPFSWQRTAQTVPRIHDITTDTNTPPAFIEVARIRQSLNVPNSLEYTEEVAAQQRSGYPDIAPVTLPVPPADAYRRALAVVTARGWEIVAADQAGGRIEATDTTRWFGFKDDVAIRVTAAPGGGSRVDVRSASRVGRSDVGTNANRVREFLAALQGPPE